jgi:hypothetical protein
VVLDPRPDLRGAPGVEALRDRVGVPAVLVDQPQQLTGLQQDVVTPRPNIGVVVQTASPTNTTPGSASPPSAPRCPR